MSGPMSWAFAWESPDGNADTALDRKRAARSGASRVAGWAFALFGTALASWLLAYGLGLYTTLGWVEGSERHNRFGVYVGDMASPIGFTTMYLFEGQTAWWDYDVAVQGTGGVRLTILRNPPQGSQIRLQRVTATSRGRLEYVVPESGFYSFRYEREPLPYAFGHTPVGRTRWRLSWGAD